MWRSITSHPYYIVRLVMTSRVLNASGEHGDQKLGLDIRAARYLCSKFPVVFVHREAVFDHDVACIESQRSDTKNMKPSFETKEISRLGNFLFIRDEVNYIQNSLVILNCGCLLQYLMTAYLWSYNALTRPAFVMPVLLPPTILCSVIGQHRLKKLNKRGECRRIILTDGVPVFRELSTTRKSESPL
ncbi:hypothetical protein GN244_ATG02848 [Phytophthora infestans]|uniref:Uncharacterized protein n=1 Tax=Phytophthora infestans TaxID=4787 RepID=A0A833W6X8_PHYIN|nr:hypothetical protein GN244_ATG02848 [Phytophthora infestans]